MEETIDIKPSDTKARTNIILRNGLLFVFILIIIMLITHMFRETMMEKSNQIAWIEYLMLLVAIIITQMQIRQKVYDGKMAYGQAFGSGMLFVALVAAVFSVFTLIFYLFIGPEVLNEMKVIAENTLREQGMDETEVKKRMDFTVKIFTPVGMFVVSLVGYLFVGTILSLIASIFTQRSR
ncbi:MAG: DUF4199 domain-containing protein [Chitinophagales bacterium]